VWGRKAYHSLYAQWNGSWLSQPIDYIWAMLGTSRGFLAKAFISLLLRPLLDS